MFVEGLLHSNAQDWRFEFLTWVAHRPEDLPCDMVATPGSWIGERWAECEIHPLPQIRWEGRISFFQSKPSNPFSVGARSISPTNDSRRLGHYWTGPMDLVGLDWEHEKPQPSRV